MSNVVDLGQHLLERGTSTFCACPHCDMESAFVPIVRKNKTGVFISALVCVGPECQGTGIFMAVENGYICEPEIWDEGDGLSGT